MIVTQNAVDVAEPLFKEAKDPSKYNVQPEAKTESDTPALLTWTPAPPTQTSPDWADILTVDLSLYDIQKNKLIETVAEALQRDGFFYVVGHGIDAEAASI